MFKVLVDATPISNTPSGVGFYTLNLIRALHLLELQEHLSVDLVYQPGFKNWLLGNFSLPESLSHYSNIYLLPVPARLSILLGSFPNPFVDYLESYLKGPKIIHGTNYSVYPSQKSLKVMTIHDLTFVKYPHFVDSVVKTFKKRVQKCLTWTDLIITVSESSKRDIVEYLEVAPEKIHVTPLASKFFSVTSFDISPKSHEEKKPNEEELRFTFSNPYILYVSTIEPRKNVIGLIKAFNYLKDKFHIEHELVLVGKKGWSYEPVFRTIAESSWREQIHYLDYLSDDALPLLYANADVFAYPSYYEGFGLPVLEAMTLGTPVVTSNTSSLPEVVGDAAVLIDPQDPFHLADGLLKVISSPSLRNELIRKGKAQAALYSWERTAKETLKAYRSLL